MGYTIEQLEAMGATPVQTGGSGGGTPTAPKKKYTLQELQKMGATPTQATAPTPTPQPQGAPSLGQKLAGRVGQAVTGTIDNMADVATGKVNAVQGMNRAPLRIAGAVTGAANDVISEALAPLFNKVVDKISDNKTVQKVAGLPKEKDPEKPSLIEKGVERYKRFEEENPRDAQDVRDIANIGSFAPFGKGASLAQQAVKKSLPTPAPKVPSPKQTAKGMEAIGRTLQGAPEDRAVGQRVLTSVDTTGVKTYRDLTKTIDERVKMMSKKQDELLDTDQTPRKLSELVLKEKVSGTEVAHNYVADALHQLSNYYSKTNNPTKLREVALMAQKANKEGLTNREINELARIHGRELNAFNANGELASGLTKIAAENTRMGVKNTARQLFGDPISKSVDEEISELIKVRDLSTDMEVAVNKLAQKVMERGLGAKVGRALVDVFDVISGGFIKGAGRALLVPRGQGYHTLNALDLEKQLAKNLKFIRDTVSKGKSDDEIIERIEQFIRASKEDGQTSSNLRGSETSPRSSDLNLRTSSLQSSTARSKSSRTAPSDLLIKNKSTSPKTTANTIDMRATVPLGQKNVKSDMTLAVPALSKKIADKAVAKKAAELTKKNGGVTINLDGDVPTAGYAYSPFKDVETIVPEKEFSQTHVDNFVNKHYDKLSQQGNHLGVWVDDGKVYMDISKVNPDEQGAVLDSIANNQIGLFDLSTFETKYIKNYEKTGNTYTYKREVEGTNTGGSTGAVAKEGDKPVVSQPKITDIGGFERAKGLSPEKRKLEEKAFQYVLKNEDKIVKEYLAKSEGGKYVNADDFRPFFKSVGYSDGKLAAGVQEPSSYLAKRARAIALQNPGDYVVGTAGGSGVGKTSAAKTIKEIAELQKDAAMILDSNFSSIKSARGFLKEVEEAGKQFVGIFTYRDFMDAVENGVVKRMLANKSEMGRLVPTKVVAQNHSGSFDVVKQLVAEGHKFRFVDNSLGQDKAKIVPLSVLKKKVKYTSVESMTRQANALVKRLYETKKPFVDSDGVKHYVTKEQYESLIE